MEKIAERDRYAVSGTTPEGTSEEFFWGVETGWAGVGTSKTRRFWVDSRCGPISRMVARLAKSKLPMLCGGPVPAARGKQEFRRESLTCSRTKQLRTKNSRVRRPSRQRFCVKDRAALLTRQISSQRTGRYSPALLVAARGVAASSFSRKKAVTRSMISLREVSGRKPVRACSLSTQGTRRIMSSKPGS